MHRSIYQRYAEVYAAGKEVLVVSEPVVLIRYPDLHRLEPTFCYDFPCKLLGKDARTLFVERLRELLSGKSIEGCLPRHHAALITDAVGKTWKNYWRGDLFQMMHKAKMLHRRTLK